MDFSQEQIEAAYGKLPRAVREYLLGSEFNALMRDLGARYRLHVDTAGALSLATSYLLIGLLTPQQFSDNLVRLGLGGAMGADIIRELNQKTFVPLQEKMRNPEPEEERAPEPVAAAQGPVPEPAVPMPAVEWNPAPAPTAPAQMAAAAVLPGTDNVPVPAAPAISAAPVPMPAARTMQSDFGNVVTPTQAAPVPAPVFTPAAAPAPAPAYTYTPAPVPQPAAQPMPAAMSMPAYQLPPDPTRAWMQNAPAAPMSAPAPTAPPMRAATAPVMVPRPAATPPQSVSAASQPAAIPAKSANRPLNPLPGGYGIDPYREPFE